MNITKQEGLFIDTLPTGQTSSDVWNCNQESSDISITDIGKSMTNTKLDSTRYFVYLFEEFDDSSLTAVVMSRKISVI